MSRLSGTLLCLVLAIILLSGSFPVGESAIGVNWGTISFHRLKPSTVVDLLKDNKIKRVKLFDADPGSLTALMGSGIEVMVGIPNEMLAALSSSTDASDLWVRQNVSRYVVKGGADIRYVAVGNEPFLTSYSGQFQSFVVPALLNLQQSLVKANLAGYVKLVVPCNADAYESSLPSQGAFRPELTQIMTQLVSFLNSNGSPFVVNIYPFLSLYGNSDFPQDYAFFEGSTHPVTDGSNVYYNAFDGNFDTLVAALNKLGYGQMPIVIGEVGWPTDGAIGANLTAARVFNQGLIKHVLSNKGTPLRPDAPPMDIYLFALLDEGAKSVLPGNFERHWGIFSFDGQAKYALNLGLGNKLLKNAKNVEYLPSRWCVADPSKDLTSVANHLRIACSAADCTTLNYGGSCNEIGAKGNISYAFNSYYQLQMQNAQSCDFDGLGMVTFLDPSVGDCRFPVGVNDHKSSLAFRSCRRWTTIWTSILGGGSSCSSTLYPELCYSAVATVPGATSNLASQKDVIELSINLTTKAVQHNFFTVEKLIATKKLTKREKTALHDCLEIIDETLDELHEALVDLNDYPNNKSLKKHADDLKTLLSSAITNQETCLDGFSHDEADKKVRKALLKGQIHVEKMCSNVLAMIKNMTDTDVANELKTTNRKLMQEKEGNESEWPEWMSVADRRLLQSSSVTPDVVVAADGSGNYKTVSAAVAAAPKKSSKRYIIRIKAGVYRENVDVPKDKTNIMFMGDGRKTTIITASRNVVDGSTTFNSATVAAVGQGFLARGITFQNTAGPSKHQAVALRVGSDLSAFYDCDMLAYQDTLYVHSNRQFFINCLVAGTVDFIFGNAAVVLQDCDIHARRPNSGQKNMVTAQGRTDPNQNTGIVIQKSRIGATSDLQPVKSSFPTYLGRPWKEYSRTVIMQSSITDVIQPAGWFEWSGSFALNTLYYAEYQNSGAGAGTSRRVTWKGYRVITSATEAQRFTPGNFIAGSSWLRSTTFPFSLGL